MKDKSKFDYLEQLESIEIPKLKEELAPYAAYKRQGDFTIDDYNRFPDEHRIELIDGIIYDMTAPTYIHQGIAGEIYNLFRNYIRKNKGRCMVFISPADVQLDCNNKTMVQPDVFVLCDKSKLKKQVLFGYPDLIVEVLSPSTRTKDIHIKTRKYRLAGVREYWLVDPMKRQVFVHNFEKGNLSSLYTFEDKVPVGIWDDKCEVDFKEIYEYVKFLEDTDDMNDDTDSTH